MNIQEIKDYLRSNKIIEIFDKAEFFSASLNGFLFIYKSFNCLEYRFFYVEPITKEQLISNWHIFNLKTLTKAQLIDLIANVYISTGAYNAKT